MKSCGGRCDPGQSFETRPKLFYTIEREREKKKTFCRLVSRARAVDWTTLAPKDSHLQSAPGRTSPHVLKLEIWIWCRVSWITYDYTIWLYYIIILYDYIYIHMCIYNYLYIYIYICIICTNRIWSNQELCGRQSMEPLLSEIIPWPPQNAERRRFGGRNVALSLPAPQKIRVEWCWVERSQGESGEMRRNEEKWGEIQHYTTL